MERDTAELRKKPYLHAASAIPVGETLVGLAPVEPGEALPHPEKGLRPVVFEGHRNRRGPVTRALFAFERLLDWHPGNITTGDPEKRERYKKRKAPLFGTWDSVAGRLTRSLYPRSKVTVLPVMVMTDRRLHVVWVEGLPPRKGTPLPAVLGWSIDRQELHWVRHRRDRNRRTYELGFTDGSWARVEFGDPAEDVSVMFPQPLHYRDPVP